MIKIGIIGCGKIAQVRHIPEYRQNPDCEIVGYYDLNLARAQALASEFGGKAYVTLEEMLRDKDIDAVSVCVANISHCGTKTLMRSACAWQTSRMQKIQ